MNIQSMENLFKCTQQGLILFLKKKKKPRSHFDEILIFIIWNI